jgi:N-formylglutamate deformylase
MNQTYRFSKSNPRFTTFSREDKLFIDKFEAAILSEEQFHHKEHIKIAWLYLQLYPVSEVLQRLSNGIKQLAQAFDRPGLYHETITWLYVFIINERMKKMGQSYEWWRFMENNEDIFVWGDKSLIKKYYKEETLQSAAAKEWFHLPDNFEFQFDL